MLDFKTIKQIAWMCELNPEQFTRLLRTGGGRDFYDVMVRDDNTEPVMAMLSASIDKKRTDKHYHYRLTFRDATVKKTFKPFIQILRGLEEQGDITLTIDDENNQESLL